MKRSLIKGHLTLFTSNKVLLTVSLIVIINMSTLGAIKLTDASKDNMKLSEFIKEYSELSLPQFYSSPRISTSNLPKILLTDGDKPMLAAANFNKLLLIDPTKSGLSKTFDIRKVFSILTINGIDGFFIRHTENSEDKLSRLDIKSGKILWSIPINFTSFYLYRQQSVTYTATVPFVYSKIPGTQKIFSNGLTLKKAKLFGSWKYMNRLFILDTETGEIAEDKKFHFRRSIADFVDLFMNSEKMEFEAIDILSGKTYFKGKYNISDFLGSKKFHPVGKRKFANWNLGGWEFSGLLTANGLIISARHSYYFQGGIKSSSWVTYDLKGNRIKKLIPSPMSSVDLAVRDLGKDNWPLYLPNIIGRKGRRCEVNKFLVLKKDGTFTEVPLPVIEGVKSFKYLGPDNWFHDGNKIYYLRSQNLYSFKIGEKTGKLLFKNLNKKENWNSMPYGDNKYVVLTHGYYTKKKRAILVRLSDGKIILPSEFSNELGTTLWQPVLDYNHSYEPIPREGLPLTFKDYSNYEFGGIFSGEIKKCNKVKNKPGYNMLKIWGSLGGTAKYGDIGIVPAILKDKSVILVGISIPGNKVLFYVPVLRIRGLPVNEYLNGNVFPFNVINLNEKESLLILFENLNSLKIYKIQRPLM